MKRKTMKKIKRSHLLPALAILAISPLLMMFSACNSSTSPKTGTLTGRVELVNDTGNPELDPVDFSGVRIAIYELTTLDTTITRINREYPHIGVMIGQDTEFDHRDSMPIYKTITASDGSFSQGSVALGRYNVVISKENWGIRYFHNIQITPGTNDLNNLISMANIEPRTTTDIKLYPEVVLSSFIQGDFGFDSYKTYVIEDDLTINGDVVFNEGTRIEINAMKSMMINGTLNAELSSSGSYSLVTSAYNSQGEATQSGGIVVNGNVILENCVIEYSLNGIKMNGAQSIVRNCVIRKSSGGMAFENNERVDISNSIASVIRDAIPSIYTSSGGFYALRCDEVSIDNVVLHSNTAGVKIKDYCDAQVRNSFFVLNNYGVESYASLTTIENNVLEKNGKYDVRVCGGEFDPVIQRNYLLSDKGICIGLDMNFNYYDCTPIIHDNNFRDNEVAMHIIGFNRFDVDASMNYFYTSDAEMIKTLIIDRDDFVYHGHPNMVLDSTGKINYTPFRSFPVLGAGIE